MGSLEHMGASENEMESAIEGIRYIHHQLELFYFFAIKINFPSEMTPIRTHPNSDTYQHDSQENKGLLAPLYHGICNRGM